MKTCSSRIRSRTCAGALGRGWRRPRRRLGRGADAPWRSRRRAASGWAGTERTETMQSKAALSRENLMQPKSALGAGRNRDTMTRGKKNTDGSKFMSAHPGDEKETEMHHRGSRLRGRSRCRAAPENLTGGRPEQKVVTLALMGTSRMGRIRTETTSWSACLCS
jgi:hypothetical protein